MKRLKCRGAGSCRGVRERGEVRGAEGEEIQGSLLESLLGGEEEKEEGERACAAGGRKQFSLSEDM